MKKGSHSFLCGFWQKSVHRHSGESVLTNSENNFFEILNMKGKVYDDVALGNLRNRRGTRRGLGLFWVPFWTAFLLVRICVWVGGAGGGEGGCVCVCACVRARVYVWVCLCEFLFFLNFLCVCIRYVSLKHLFPPMYICTNTYIYIYMWKWRIFGVPFSHQCIYIHVHIHIYIYFHIYMWEWRIFGVPFFPRIHVSH